MQPPDDAAVLLRTGRFFVTQETQSLPSGATRTREIVRHPGSVVILPLVDDQHVCLIRNWRLSVKRSLIELPAGTLEPPEPPLACEQRELAEETGYRAEKWHELAAFYPAPGILDERMHLFVAQGLTDGTPAREPGEDIENLVVSWTDAMQMVRSGQIEDGKTLLGLLLFQSRATDLCQFTAAS